ncbi:MAG: hypothetical protein AUJ52_04985 [Elusimicrobia bacterium CG1_02_63_36]|nr:MAG: hypothetical protein AUJ52_04985 [Elusimicrobia bacterium CG1_02_63_36]PIP82153.1 MAG: hypothetical protein COR54_16385 [Elusimicrobia bacterium CG22_combo_CG10-13_8_21_14_all_63_91]PJA14047.1 MAG: hypothetical protein COX66_13630 [Elusimicrobia bacterium CG_4_10_14_0_2_um_filter_63_34]PJB22960.1 MAG: hypothetical protein CO113_19815 [Elusimicrobia bacterium CG_4_9_14_3_um_filter_62_55]
MIVKVRVIPNAPENEVISRIGSVLRVKVKAKEVNEKANAALTGYLAEFFEVKPRSINIIRGAKGREKTIEITGKTEEALKRVMEAIP